ncbi:G-protein coupled receptor 55 [Pteronotus mesoamericanus]|uniref:G-protein coupled receptor 55 n=1 Tax=Pteronotus mesoamericanus TaxID=1884717 RepID=UPI0023ED4FFE|nr:G-protein coupled receptor 55 [Pteronotus parnellii mesoamericanus]
MSQSNPGNNCSFADVDRLMQTVQLVVHIPTFLLGLVLNLLAIQRFRTFLRKELSDYVATSIYMINLAVFDLLMVLSLLFKVVLVYEQAPFPSLCTLVECLYFISMYGSILTICFISLDRYVAIQYPIPVRHCRSPRKIFGICCTIWVLVWVGSIPFYNFSGEVERYTCFNNMSSSIWSAKLVFPVEVFGFLLPLGVMGFCSSRSIHILVRRHEPHQDPHQDPRQDPRRALSQLKRACIWTIASNLVVFVVSFLPVHLAGFLQFLVRNNFIVECRARQNISLFLKLSMCLSNVNCCLDVFCYYFTIKEFRTGIKAPQKSKDQVNLSLTTVAGEESPPQRRETPAPSPSSRHPVPGCCGGTMRGALTSVLF